MKNSGFRDRMSVMKILLFLLLALPAYPQVKVNYDKFKDQTIITSDGAHITPSLRMVVKALHKGTHADDVQYFLLFQSFGKEWKYLKNHGLIFLADGDRIEFGNGWHDGKVSSSRYVNVEEVMTYRISKEDLERFSNSSSLELKLGFTEAKLGERDKKGLKEMLEYK